MLNSLRISSFPAASLFLISLLFMPIASADELRDLANKMAISEALAQYSYRWDSKNALGFTDLFTADAVMERWRKGKLVAGSRIEGSQAILEYARNSHQGRLADRQTRHHFSGLVFVELSDSNAVTENMALITQQTESDRAARISSSGIYRISWINADHGWKISKRVLFADSFPAE